ncbi:Hypothetical protein NTJ_10700 [Nesidiocoris tenuis]|uniref:Resistance to inhibitors of cholinesterase protein 3 N-terminal domain-containing protein n=1 Tax=Nesidiocoris tenuis TaxID=355587 RepID=A0ABN7B0F2_9HEMI|nr:Hypothetical protein NTJ_10700 [Nesidiocoris tenuis]
MAVPNRGDQPDGQPPNRPKPQCKPRADRSGAGNANTPSKSGGGGGGGGSGGGGSGGGGSGGVMRSAHPQSQGPQGSEEQQGGQPSKSPGGQQDSLDIESLYAKMLVYVLPIAIYIPWAYRKFKGPKPCPEMTPRPSRSSYAFNRSRRYEEYADEEQCRQRRSPGRRRRCDDDDN